MATARRATGGLARGLVPLLLLGLCACASQRSPVVVERSLSGAGPAQHVVAPGETLYSIAVRYDKDYRELAQLNHLDDRFTIRPGQRLRLRGAPAAPARPFSQASSVATPAPSLGAAPVRAPLVAQALPPVVAKPPAQGGNQAQLSARPTAKAPLQEPNKDTTKDTGKETAKLPVAGAAKAAAGDAGKEAGKESARPVGDKAGSATGNKTIAKAASKPGEQAADKPSQKGSDKAVDKADQKSGDKTAAKGGGKAVEVVEKGAGKVVAASGGRSAETPSEKGESSSGKASRAVASEPDPSEKSLVTKKQSSPTTDNSAKVSASLHDEKESAWVWPAKGPLIGHFGGAGLGGKGLDIGGRRGDSVMAAASGVVVYAGSALVGYGRLLILRHDDNYISAYAHNDRFLVKEGERVRSGQAIAEMGASGADREKLHFEIRERGKPVDPLRFLPARD